MPHFEVVNQNGELVTSEQLLGRKTIIYFYPKDNTSGCTAEACSLRDNYAELTERGYNVVGVSKDGAASRADRRRHSSFRMRRLPVERGGRCKRGWAWFHRCRSAREYLKRRNHDCAAVRAFLQCAACQETCAAFRWVAASCGLPCAG